MWYSSLSYLIQIHITLLCLQCYCLPCEPNVSPFQLLRKKFFICTLRSTDGLIHRQIKQNSTLMCIQTCFASFEQWSGPSKEMKKKKKSFEFYVKEECRSPVICSTDVVFWWNKRAILMERQGPEIFCCPDGTHTHTHTHTLNPRWLWTSKLILFFFLRSLKNGEGRSMFAEQI